MSKSIELEQRIRRLKVRGSAFFVAAESEDERRAQQKKVSAAATALRRAGVIDFIVITRNAEGGINVSATNA